MAGVEGDEIWEDASSLMYKVFPGSAEDSSFIQAVSQCHRGPGAPTRRCLVGFSMFSLISRPTVWCSGASAGIQPLL